MVAVQVQIRFRLPVSLIGLWGYGCLCIILPIQPLQLAITNS